METHQRTVSNRPGMRYFHSKIQFAQKHAESTTRVTMVQSTISHNAIWIKLSQLPTEFYDNIILEKIDRKLGALLKIGTCTSATLEHVMQEY
ncbi:hypothetical protein H5410_023102, partial [Solanum commersonii]